MKQIRTLAFAGFLVSLLATSSFATPKLGIAMHGEPAMKDDYKSLPYANPDAPQGGTLRQAVTGTFDSLNPFIVKGSAGTGGRTYVFESLMARSYAESFSLYGLLAQSIDVSDDRQTFTFKIRPEAKFSDGTPVTAADVIFSMETLRDHGRPNYKTNYSKISKVETSDDHTVTFHQEKGDQELPLIIGLMPILPKAQWAGKDFEASSIEPLIGSGPYMFGEVKPGESIILKKNPNYWGKEVAFNKGLWNFDTLRFDYYKDANAAFEAFKKGDVDVRMEADPVRWNTGYQFPAVTDGKVSLEKVEQHWPAATTGYAFNTRRKIFENPLVREALVNAFDFEWANANLFSNSFRRTYGFYAGSSLSSKGKAADAAELAILGDDKGGLRADMLDGSYDLPLSDGSGHDRKLLRKAVDLLAKAGWTVKENGLVNEAGEQFAFAITIQNAEQQKIALHYQRTLQQIGIKVEVKMVDDAQFTNIKTNFDFDMIPMSIFNSMSPGNEQTLYVGSATKSSPGSRNLAGVADPHIDKAIEAMLHAKTYEDFAAAVRAEDRLLVAGFYIVPFYDLGGNWVARWNYIGKPDAQPLTGFEATTLWRKP
jgi:peptide/nickel transport system substrate-binding protein